MVGSMTRAYSLIILEWFTLISLSSGKSLNRNLIFRFNPHCSWAWPLGHEIRSLTSWLVEACGFLVWLRQASFTRKLGRGSASTGRWATFFFHVGCMPVDRVWQREPDMDVLHVGQCIGWEVALVPIVIKFLNLFLSFQTYTFSVKFVSRIS